MSFVTIAPGTTARFPNDAQGREVFGLLLSRQFLMPRISHQRTRPDEEVPGIVYGVLVGEDMIEATFCHYDVMYRVRVRDGERITHDQLYVPAFLGGVVAEVSDPATFPDHDWDQTITISQD